MTPQRAATILKLTRPWTTERIKKAFRKQSRATHPDRNQKDPQAEAKFKEVATARETLDAHLEALKNPPPPQRPMPPPRRRPESSSRARHSSWNQRGAWYDTGDARGRAARSDPYFQNRPRVDPRRQPRHGAPYQDHQEEGEEDDGAAKAGDIYIVKGLTIGNMNVNPATVRAQLQKVADGYRIAVYLTVPLPVVAGNIQIVLAEDGNDPGSVFVKPVASRSYNTEGLVTTIWFRPF